MYNRFRCAYCDVPMTTKGVCPECAKEIRKDIEKREIESQPGG